MPKTASHAVRATRRDWLALAILMIPVLLVSVDNTVLSFALPIISTSLTPTGNQLMWIVDVYPLMLAGLLIPMGALGDRLGRRRLLLVGSAAFGAASLLAAFSANAHMLIVARIAQGVAGATLMPSTLSLIRNIFTDRKQRRIAIATWAAMFSGGAALGPIMGGWLLEHFWWGSVFLINLPLIVLFLAAAWLVISESRDPDPGRIDVPSIGLSLLAMFPFVLAIKKFAANGLSDVVIAVLAVGIASAIAFVRRQKRLTHPMLDVALFKNRVFAGAVTANLLSMMACTGFLFFGAQYLQLVLGHEPLDAATLLIPGLLATVIAGFVVVKVVDRFSTRAVVAGSFALSAAGFAIAAVGAGGSSAAAFVISFAVLGTGIGFAETITNDLVLSNVPASKAGAASAISETAYEIGSVLGTAILGSVLLAVYRNEIHVPRMVAQEGRSIAMETLGGAAQVAQQYGGHTGEFLMSSANSAFITGIHFTCAAAVVIALLAAAVSWRALRGADA